jgi:Zn-dependent alcohol dehydrogenase
MHAMILKKLKTPLEWLELPDRLPGRNEIRVRVLACGVCRTARLAGLVARQRPRALRRSLLAAKFSWPATRLLSLNAT